MLRMGNMLWVFTSHSVVWSCFTALNFMFYTPIKCISSAVIACSIYTSNKATVVLFYTSVSNLTSLILAPEAPAEEGEGHHFSSSFLFSVTLSDPVHSHSVLCDMDWV